MLTAHDDGDALFDAIMAGAAGYVLKQISSAGLTAAVRAVAAGVSVLDPDAPGKMMARTRQAGRPDPLAGLTGNERGILELIGEGLTNRQVAERMCLSEKTVKNYASASTPSSACNAAPRPPPMPSGPRGRAPGTQPTRITSNRSARPEPAGIVFSSLRSPALVRDLLPRFDRDRQAVPGWRQRARREVGVGTRQVGRAVEVQHNRALGGGRGS